MKWSLLMVEQPTACLLASAKPRDLLLKSVSPATFIHFSKMITAELCQFLQRRHGGKIPADVAGSEDGSCLG